MRVVVEIAMDRMPNELVDQFVQPLDTSLRSERLGRVVKHVERNMLSLDVSLTVRGMKGFERVLQFLVEHDAPIGTVTYRLDWLGRRKDIGVLGPEYY